MESRKASKYVSGDENPRESGDLVRKGEQHFTAVADGGSLGEQKSRRRRSYRIAAANESNQFLAVCAR